MPTLFVAVMLKDWRKLTRFAVELPPDKVNGTSSKKLPPKPDAAEPWNHEADGELRSIVRLLGLKVWPDCGVN